jgi:host factor-I protein
MKEAIEQETMERSAEPEGFANRKLIRPVLNRVEHGQHAPNHSSGHGPNHAPNHASNHTHGPSHVSNHVSNHASGHGHGAPGGDRRGGPSSGKKTPPAETTHAENFYYQKQMQSKTQMVVVLRDGEEVHGIIEWYDRTCLKLNRLDGPNLMIYKPSIKYMYKEGEEAK